MKAFAEEAVDFLGNRSGAELARDRLRFLAVTRAAEVVGEAASQVARSAQSALPDIDFASAIAMRHRLVHGYGAISATILADTVRSDFPPLIAALERALAAPLPDDPA